MALQGIDYGDFARIPKIVDGTDAFTIGGVAKTGILGGMGVIAKDGGNPGEYTYPSAGGSIAGVLNHDTPNGEPSTIFVGVGKVMDVVAGAAVAANKELMITAAGKFIEHAAGAADADNQKVGISEEAAAGNNSVFKARIYPGLLAT